MPNDLWIIVQPGGVILNRDKFSTFQEVATFCRGLVRVHGEGAVDGYRFYRLASEHLADIVSDTTFGLKVVNDSPLRNKQS